jgi:hypothetical protein
VDWVNKISFHAKLPPSLQLLSYDDTQKVRWSWGPTYIGKQWGSVCAQSYGGKTQHIRH